MGLLLFRMRMTACDILSMSFIESDVALMSCGIQKEQKQFIKMAECQHQCGILVEKSSKKVKVPRYQSQHADERYNSFIS